MILLFSHSHELGIRKVKYQIQERLQKNAAIKMNHMMK